MSTTSAASPSVLHLDHWRDHTISVTFREIDPIGLSEVTIDPDPLDNGVLLHLVEAAIVRLAAYHRDFIDAEAADLTPAPFRMPLYGLANVYNRAGRLVLVPGSSVTTDESEGRR